MCCRIRARGVLAGALSLTLAVVIPRDGAARQGQVPLPQQEQAPRQLSTAAQSGRAAAIFDVTGYWVSVIDEDWRWRMLTPPKGDNSGVPLTIEGRRVTDLWDPAKDEAAGLECKSYGAAAIMRVPTRLHITWQDDHTLKIETDAGIQTRLLHFDTHAAAPSERTWQGYSVATWETDGGGRRGAGPSGPRDLKVLTTHMRAGYLRKNGVPFSENAGLTEYFDLFPKQPNGDEWLVVTGIVADPQYLTERFITSSNFKREPDGSKWHPTPCAAR